MNLAYFGRPKEGQSGCQAQKYYFGVSFVDHIGSVEET